MIDYCISIVQCPNCAVDLQPVANSIKIAANLCKHSKPKSWMILSKYKKQSSLLQHTNLLLLC